VAPAARASRTSSKLFTSTSIFRSDEPSSVCQAMALMMPPAAAMWLSLISMRRNSPKRCSCRAHAHRVFFQRPQPGEGLSGVQDLGAGALQDFDEPCRMRCDARKMLHHVQGDTLTRQKRPRFPWTWR